MSEFRLFKKKGDGWEWHAWVSPEGVCFTSRMRSTGNGLLRWGVIAPDLAGKAVVELKMEGFKEVETKMTQEQLSKGWLL